MSARPPLSWPSPGDEVTLDDADWRCPRTSTLGLRSVGALAVRVDSVGLDTVAGWTLDAGPVPVRPLRGHRRSI